MNPVEIEEKAQEVFDALGRQLRLRGKTLQIRLKHSGRLMPRRLRRDVAYLADAVALSANPRLIRQLDFARLRRAHCDGLRWLAACDPKARARDLAWSMAGSAGLAVLFVTGGFIAVLAWQGLI